ncbi:MAG: 5-(carboxyamino)imidazole ribonucleotide mutase [Clostridia bacterium]|nr:5-(carboxyamino)imidazole ribonucleotide mutase [Clostridia bacterium]
MSGKVCVIMGSKSDFDVVKPCLETLKAFGVEFEARVLSAHRTPVEAVETVENAEKRGVEVVIGVAGKAAHLAGVLAAHTSLPVIGLPTPTSVAGGLDSLLSTVQMPGGIPVATVAVGGGENAALLAVRILAVKYSDLKKRYDAHREAIREKTLKADAELQKLVAEIR